MSDKKMKALPAQFVRTDRARREAGSVPAGLSSSSDDGRVAACPAGAATYVATAKTAGKGGGPPSAGSGRGGEASSKVSAEELRREEVMEDLSRYDGAGEIDSGIPTIDLQHTVHEIAGDLEDLVGCLVPQRGRMYRLFAGATKTLRGVLGELLHRREMYGPGVDSTVSQDRWAEAVEARAALMQRARAAEKELKELKEAREAGPPAGEEAQKGTVPVPSASAGPGPDSGLGITEAAVETIACSLADYVDRRIGALREELSGGPLSVGGSGGGGGSRGTQGRGMVSAGPSSTKARNRRKEKSPSSAPARAVPARKTGPRGGPKAKKAVAVLGRRPARAAVVLSVQEGSGRTYASILKEAMSSVDVGPLGISEVRPKRTLGGGLLLEVPGPNGEERADRLAERLSALFKDREGVRATRPTRYAEVRVKGLVDPVTRGDVTEALVKAGGCREGEVRTGEIRLSPSGVGTLWARMPLRAARRVVAAGRLRVGWLSVPVEALRARPPQCYRCLAFGHVGHRCTSGTVRSHLCYRCGAPSHKARECQAPPSCPICSAEGRPDGHRMGGRACPLPSARAKRGVTGCPPPTVEKSAASAAARSPSPPREQSPGGDETPMEVDSLASAEAAGPPTGKGCHPSSKRKRKKGGSKSGESRGSPFSSASGTGGAEQTPLPKRRSRGRGNLRRNAGSEEEECPPLDRDPFLYESSDSDTVIPGDCWGDGMLEYLERKGMTGGKRGK